MRYNWQNCKIFKLYIAVIWHKWTSIKDDWISLINTYIISLIYLFPLSLFFCFGWDHLSSILPANLSHITHFINYSHHIIRWLLRSYSSYSWKFVFTNLSYFPSPATEKCFKKQIYPSLCVILKENWVMITTNYFVMISENNFVA